MRIAFDLDETLGVPIIENNEVVGFVKREGSEELLKTLGQEHELILWTVSNRRYLNKILAYGLGEYFKETYSWDEITGKWKDIRKLNIDYLIDDSNHHFEEAKKYHIEQHYIIVPAYGATEDRIDPLSWTKIILKYLEKMRLSSQKASYKLTVLSPDSK